MGAVISGGTAISDRVDGTVSTVVTYTNAPEDASFIAHYFSNVIKIIWISSWTIYFCITTFIIFIIPMIPSIIILGMLCAILYVIHIIWEYLRIGVNGYIIPGINESVKGTLTGVNGAIDVADFIVNLPNMIGDKFKKLFK